MSLRPLLPAILLALVMSIVVGVLATGRDSGPTLAVGVGLFVAQITFAMVRVNAPYWNADVMEMGEGTVVVCAWRNAVLAALTYTWGATAMLAIYSLSNLVWRHWWQYGAGMALIAAGIFLYSFFLINGRGALRTPPALAAVTWLTGLQGAGVLFAFIYLVFAGKFVTPRGDWAASYIFAAGSLALALLSLISIVSYRKLVRRTARA